MGDEVDLLWFVPQAGDRTVPGSECDKKMIILQHDGIAASGWRGEQRQDEEATGKHGNWNDLTRISACCRIMPYGRCFLRRRAKAQQAEHTVVEAAIVPGSGTATIAYPLNPVTVKLA